MWSKAMSLIIALLVTTIGLTLILKYAVTPNYGADIEDRFLERSAFIPSRSTRLTLLSFRSWLADPANKQAKAGYGFPVLIPCDIAFLLSLGLLLGVSSAALAGHLSFLSQIPRWIWWIIPTAYMIADLLEDGIIALHLRDAIQLTSGSFFLLSLFKSLKLATVSAAIGQVVFLGILTMLLQVFPAAA
jgi:hypothetical protein